MPESHPAPEIEPQQKPLTPQMIAVIQNIARGLTYSQTGHAMGISRYTVRTYAYRAFFRLGVNSRSAAVAVAVAQGLVKV